MSKYVFTSLDRYEVINSTVVVFESEKESLVEILEEVLNNAFGEEVFAEEYSEYVKEGINCCGIDLEEKSYLLTKIT